MGSQTRVCVVVAAAVIAVGGGAWVGPSGDDPGGPSAPRTSDGWLVDRSPDANAAPERGARAGEVPTAAVPTAEVPTAEALRGRHLPDEVESGTFTTVPGASEPVGRGRLRTVAVGVEDGLEVDAAAFAEEVERILLDPRGWTADGTVALQRVDTATADVRVTLASPATVDAECHPLETGGRFSCWNGERAMLNVWRWRHGASAFGDDIDGYRAYLVNHEVGHALGHGHVGCPAPGAPAPVMMQQTIGVEPCVANPWPYPHAGG